MGKTGGLSVDDNRDITTADDPDTYVAGRILAPALKLRAKGAQVGELIDSYQGILRQLEAAFAAHCGDKASEAGRNGKPLQSQSEPAAASASPSGDTLRAGSGTPNTAGSPTHSPRSDNARANPANTDSARAELPRARATAHSPATCGTPATESDGVDLVVQAVVTPTFADTNLLKAAIQHFRSQSTTRVRAQDYRLWLVSMSNLGCALTLLGQCRCDSGIADLEEAVDVFRALLNDRTIAEMPLDRASVNVNLAGALQALADLAMPVERLSYLNHAVESMAAALSLIAPSKFDGCVEMWRGIA
jgi:hypothetical protein